jgi:uncharacterized membrane protein
MTSPGAFSSDRRRAAAAYILRAAWAIVLRRDATVFGGGESMYPRVRFDTLSDGIFGVAMTLLVLDLRLPDELNPQDGRELFAALYGLMPKLIPYVLSFLVLGLRWVSTVQVRSKAEHVGRDYFHWWLVYHLLVTFVPFTTYVVGRFPTLAPAVWLYAGNTALIALVSFGVLATTPKIERDFHYHDRRASIAVLLVSALLAIAWSFVSARFAMWFLALNAASPVVSRWTQARERAHTHPRPD